jgi:putative glutamine amidotransferase
VQEQAGLNDHRSVKGQPPEVQYAAAHEVQVMPGGRLAALLDRKTFPVNSLHGQGVKQLAPGLRIEATAQDGLVEAFSVAAARGFTMCVQWHPEWQAAGNPVSMALLKAFGQACAQYQERQGRDPET